MEINNRRIKQMARATLGSLAESVWHISDAGMAELISTLEAAAESGLQSTSRFADLLPESNAYSRRAQFSGGMLVLNICGAIQPDSNVITEWFGGTACSALRTDLRRAKSDSSVSEIALIVDSPGGSAMGLEETAKLISEVASEKPVTAYVKNLCASAAYYLASAASKIVASPSSAVGSIGSIIMHMEISGMLKEYGYNVTPITFGKHKADGNQYQPLTAQSRETLQNFVDSYGKQFVDAVARQRKISTQVVMERFGQGRVYIASEALERGMIDEIGSIEDRVPGSMIPVGQTRMQSATWNSATALTPSNEVGSSVAIGQTTASAVSNQTPAGQSEPRQAVPSMEKKKVMKLTALLYSLGLVASLEATSETVDAAVAAFCHARGVEVPRSADGKLNEAECIKLINGSSSKPANQAGVAPNVAEAHAREQGEAKNEMTLPQYQERKSEIKAIANLINAGRVNAVVSAIEIESAVDGKQSIQEIRDAWAKKLESSESGQGISTSVGGFQMNSGEDRFVQNAVNSLLSRMGYETSSQVPVDMRRMSLLDIGLQCSRLRGQNISAGSYADRELVALELLQQSPHVHVFSSHSGSVNRPGDFPNLLSNLAGKILDNALVLADATYSMWTQRMMDVADFKAQTVLATGAFSQLDEIMDGEAAKQLKMTEELKGWFQVGQFGNSVLLTPRMIANDDLDSFNQHLTQLMMAHELTLNSICIGLLEGNVTLADGIALFNASHGNLETTTTGAPSTTTAPAMKLLHRKQAGIGTTRPISSYPRVVLVPSEYEDAAEQTYLSLAEIASRGGESKLATTDATVNVHRGRTEVVTEVGLASATRWYTIDNRLRTIVHGFQTGYGRGGQRSTWWDNATGCRHVKLEGRFGAAAVGYRGICRNGA